MKTSLPNLDRKEPLYRQIAQHIRAMAAAGKWAPDSQLPSTHAIAEMWKTAPQTVHRALVALEKEGVVARQHGIGTFVCKREERLTCVGIYFREDVLAKHSSDFLRAVHASVKEELNGIGVRTQVWADPRPEEDQIKPWPELCKAAEHREIQGLIVPAIDWPHIQWLNKLSIPSAYLFPVNIPNRVDFNLRQFAELSLRCLAEQGCRSVGYIGSADLYPKHVEDGSNSYLAFLERFTDLAGELGLAMRDEWMRIAGSETSLNSNVSQESFGYAEVLKLWSLSERPEGLVIYPDTMARGVILGLREKQVRVPEELKLVLHKNEVVDLLCPMPATFVVSSERACARALIEQVQKQSRGESCEPIVIDFTLSSTEYEGRIV